jgi:hypothetical protein
MNTRFATVALAMAVSPALYGQRPVKAQPTPDRPCVMQAPGDKWIVIKPPMPRRDEPCQRVQPGMILQDLLRKAGKHGHVRWGAPKGNGWPSVRPPMRTNPKPGQVGKPILV